MEAKNNLSRLQLKITGNVQAVGFRYWAREKAQQLGLTGYVQNLSDGSVEIVAEGKRGVLERFLELCHQGPARAQAKNVVIIWSEQSAKFTSFEIRG